MDHIGLLTAPIGDPAVLSALPDAWDDALPLNERTRAYLQANCAHCHGSVAIAGIDLRYATLLEQTGACDAVPDRGDLGIYDARIIAPGEPERSVLLARISRRDAHGMPPLATSLVDEDAAELIRAWIEGLRGCVL